MAEKKKTKKNTGPVTAEIRQDAPAGAAPALSKEKGGARGRAWIPAAVCIVLAVLRIWLAAHTNYAAVNNPYDDELQMRQGLSIFHGAWLGEYSLVTLIKGIVYPEFLALCARLGITYGMGLGVLTVLAAAVFAGMIMILTPDRRIAAAGFLLAAFHPAGYYGWAAVRIYRDALVPPVLTILVSCLLAVFFLREKPVVKSVPWFAGLSMSFALFRHLREDSVWILPLVVTALALTVLGRAFAGVQAGRSEEKAAGNSAEEPGRKNAGAAACSGPAACVAAAVLCIAPFALSMALGSAISAKNEAYYGLRVENDRVKGSFAEMMELIGSVDDPGVNDLVWITRDMLFRCVDASPTLKQMEEGIRYRYEESAAHQETPDGEKVSEVMGDYTQWILRNAFYDYGLYRDAAQTEEVLSGIVDELKAAYADGTLKKDARIHLSSQGRGMTAGELLAYTGRTAAGMAKLAVCGGLKSFYPFISRTSGETRKAYEFVLGISLGEETVLSGAYRAADAVFGVLVWVFRLLLAAMHAAAAVLFFRGAARCVKDRAAAPELLPALVSAAGLVLSAAALVYMITAFTSFLPEQFFYNYTTGFYPLVLAADTVLIIMYLNEKRA